MAEILSDFGNYDALGLADLVRRKEVKPIELVEESIRRIEQLNPSLNAVVTRMYDQAQRAAVSEIPEGPFVGVPYLLKEGSYCAGVVTTLGSKRLINNISDHDSETVSRIKRAGLIIVGKTNMSEWGLMATTEPLLYGPCHNPWNTKLSPGGSSGGSAAAVAAGMVPMAHGTDGGGSIRIPAAWCGLLGLKPTRARTSLSPDRGESWAGLVADNALTRSVRDSAALLDAIAGPAPGDPYWAPRPAHPFLQEVGADPGQLRIAYSTKANNGVAVHPDCVRAVHDAVSLCTELGHRVMEAEPNGWKDKGQILNHSIRVIISVSMAAAMESLDLITGQIGTKDQWEPGTWALAEVGWQQKPSAYPLAVQTIHAISREVARFFADYDIWLTPTLPKPPVPLGSFGFSPEKPLRFWEMNEELCPFTSICNVTGQPAMSVPLFWNADGLPVGVHFVARYGDEATLFRLAAQLEKAKPWAKRRPLISASR